MKPRANSRVDVPPLQTLVSATIPELKARIEELEAEERVRRRDMVLAHQRFVLANRNILLQLTEHNGEVNQPCDPLCARCLLEKAGFKPMKKAIEFRVVVYDRHPDLEQ